MEVACEIEKQIMNNRVLTLIIITKVAIVCCPIHPAKVLTMEKEPLVAMVIMAMP